jgi:putative DNA primase/helicase
MRPRILGALLNAVSCALRNKGKVSLPALPRMADFAKFIVEAEEACEWTPGSFLQAFQDHRQEQIEIVLSGDALANAILTLVQLQGEWEGPPAELLERLERLTSGKNKDWPVTRTLQQRITLLAVYLRNVGVDFSTRRANGKNLIKLKRIPTKSYQQQAFL